MKPLKDMTGMKFGSWDVIKRGANGPSGSARWICRCSICGELKLVRGNHLRVGASTKCKPCHDRTFNRKHGMYNTSTYKIWEAMVQRCTNPRDKNFYRYGARGIDVCESWLLDFMIFWEEMGDRPKDLTLERVDNNSGYSKSNCQWVTRQEQLSNTRKSHRPGNIYRKWRLVENIPFSRKSIFECIGCKRVWKSETAYVTSLRCANCKCT